jgi:hypothetical protein
VNWDKFEKDLRISLESCVTKWAFDKKVESSVFDCWIDEVMSQVKSKVKKLRSRRHNRRRSVLGSPDVAKYLAELQEKYVFVPTDKASNNLAVVCKKLIQKSLKEVGILKEPSKRNDESTYEIVDEDMKSIIKRHNRYMKSNLRLDVIPESFPFLYWIPKMHKKPFSKQRYIAASYSCTTKALSAVLTKCLKLIEKQHRFLCHGYFRNHGINPMWILNNSSSFHKLASSVNRKRNARNVCTFYFTTLYINSAQEIEESTLLGY